ncbi:MAG TPA: ABC transporter permease [Sedimenticola sp.]|nr:ABC transporter permease [Sedimenticola sp.]
MTETTLTPEEVRSGRRRLRRRRLIAFLFVAPLLIYIFVSFVAPIGTMLYRSFYHPVVSQLIPRTLESLAGWDETGSEPPPAAATRNLAMELRGLARERRSGKLAEEVNRFLPGSSSLIKSTARKLKRLPPEAIGREPGVLAGIDPRWNGLPLWRAIKKSGVVVTDSFYLTALDLTRNTAGEITQRETSVYLKLYLKSLKIALYITLLTALIGFPLAYYLATAPTRVANLLLVFVLLPFWTSLLVRTTAWIALLQTNGVVNSTLAFLHLIDEPIEMLYTQFSTIIAMTHILLPFMVLPLYSVMKGIDPSYLRAALSLGGRPLPAFVRIYLPMTTPGLAAGALLVFIISIGYYITPALVGGTKGQMISNIIAFHMQSSNNWELAAALGSLLLLLILVIYWVYDRLVGVSNIRFG